MGLMTVSNREKLESAAREGAAQHDPSHAIIVNLRAYCLAHGIAAGDGELFVIAEDAIARQLKTASTPAEQAKPALVPRGLIDRRKGERRHSLRRASGRRRTGMLKLVEDFQHLGRPERRSGRDRRAGSERRELMRRRQVRRRDER